MQSVLFIGLKVFSATGGIEKVCRVAGKVFSDFFGDNFRMLVLHDRYVPSNRYISPQKIKTCGGSLVSLFLNALILGRKSDTIILSHINLLPAGWIVKKMFPAKKLVLFIHGIEVWDGVKGFRKKMLGTCDRFISVSTYTARRFTHNERIPVEKVTVLNNCLDPFLPEPIQYEKKSLSLLTLTRLASTEKNKGYDDVIRAMADLREFPGLNYILAGKYSDDEYERLTKLARDLGVSDRVQMPGFIPDEELPGLFSKGTVYVMPSTKEGFGIVFVEAMFYGLPVISSNADGSTDALRDGRFGLLVDPGDHHQLCVALRKVLSEPSKYIVPAAAVRKEFGFDNYRNKLLEIVKDEQG